MSFAAPPATSPLESWEVTAPRPPNDPASDRETRLVVDGCYIASCSSTAPFSLGPEGDRETSFVPWETACRELRSKAFADVVQTDFPEAQPPES